MARIIDRLLERVVPKATASACAGWYSCTNGQYRWNYCCPDTGCQSYYITYC